MDVGTGAGVGSPALIAVIVRISVLVGSLARGRRIVPARITSERTKLFEQGALTCVAGWLTTTSRLSSNTRKWTSVQKSRARKGPNLGLVAHVIFVSLLIFSRSSTHLQLSLYLRESKQASD